MQRCGENNMDKQIESGKLSILDVNGSFGRNKILLNK